MPIVCPGCEADLEKVPYGSMVFRWDGIVGFLIHSCRKCLSGQNELSEEGIKENLIKYGIAERIRRGLKKKGIITSRDEIVRQVTRALIAGEATVVSIVEMIEGHAVLVKKPEEPTLIAGTVVLQATPASV